MSTFAVTNSDQVLDSVNYLLSNLDTGNVTLPDGTLIANASSGEITQYNSSDGVYGYVNQYVNLRYANNASGTSGFSINPTNSTYFGVYNSANSTPSSNPTAYVWREVAGGFGTTKTIYYSSIGGRQVLWAAANAAPSTSYVVSTANVAIDLDIVTTAEGTPGDRGPLGMGYVITTANPATANTSTLTTWFESSRTANTAPIGTGLSPVDGDTAYFTYPSTGSSVTFTYSGNVWNSAVGQVVSGNTLVANSVPGTSIVVGTITGNLITANTITGNLITAGTITGNLIAANTITANSITANSITSTQISSAYIYAGNIVSLGASLGNTSSSGYWLSYGNGDARFGGNVSIGANLNVQGLVTTGALIANTVSTNTVVPLAISSGAGTTTTYSQVISPAVASTLYTSDLTLDFTTTESNQPLFIFAQAQAGVQFTTISTSVDVTAEFSLIRTNLSTSAITSLYDQSFDVYNVTSADGRTAFYNPVWNGISDTVPAPGNYRYSIRVQYSKSGTTSGNTILYFLNRSFLVQTLKR